MKLVTYLLTYDSRCSVRYTAIQGSLSTQLSEHVVAIRCLNPTAHSWGICIGKSSPQYGVPVLWAPLVVLHTLRKNINRFMNMHTPFFTYAVDVHVTRHGSGR